MKTRRAAELVILSCDNRRCAGQFDSLTSCVTAVTLSLCEVCGSRRSLFEYQILEIVSESANQIGKDGFIVKATVMLWRGLDQ